MTRPFARRMQRVQPSAIRDLLRLGAQPDIVSFGGGYPDPALFPLDLLADIFDRAIREQGRTALQYGESAGLPALRERIAQRMRHDGVDCTAAGVLVLQGGQQGLDLVAKLLINPGDVILTENPTFLGALIAFNPYEPRYATVPVDDEGLDVEALARQLESVRDIRLIYVMPDFQNPTGVTLSLPRRQRLIELANRHDVLILEDTPYRDLRFRGSALPTLKSLDREGRVIFLGSFSKILAPGVRLGWAVAAPDLINQLGLLKLAADTQCSTLNMTAAALFLELGDVATHVQTIRDTYRLKKEAMTRALRTHLPATVTHTDPDGGMFTWLGFPEGFDAAQFLADVALPLAKVAYVPGATFFPLEPRSNYARFSYTAHSAERIEAAIASLGPFVHAALAERGRR